MSITKTDEIDYLSSKIRNIPDFPQAGIQFKDITPLLQDARALRMTSELLHEPFKDNEVNYVLGIESRGFIFGSRLAQDCDAGFIPIRKPGKLPAETLSANYRLEYGSDSVEIHEDALKSGDKIIIHDDLIATGGSALAATKLAQRKQAHIVGYSFIIELKALKGLDKLPSDPEKSVLIRY